MTNSNNVIPITSAAEHYMDGARRARDSERDRVLRIILSELETTRSHARATGTENSRAHASVQVKLQLIYEMVKN
jgi:Ni,Fe-hydrogenase III large subunit